MLGNPVAIVLHEQLRQSFRLFNLYIRGTGNVCYHSSGLHRFRVKDFHILTIDLDRHIGFRTCHEFIESQLNWLRKIE